MSKRIDEALEILVELGFPRAQVNERSALCLLALLDIGRRQRWLDATDPLLGITPIMNWIRSSYGKEYAPNTRETIRRQTMHQFVAAGLASYNPDNPKRPVNSPKAVYQVTPESLSLVRSFGTPSWGEKLRAYRQNRSALVERYAKTRRLTLVPVELSAGSLSLSPGGHSQLIKEIVEEFAPRFAPGASVIYVGDTGSKWGYFDEHALNALGVRINNHGKMPDVVLYDRQREWLLLTEAVTSHGPVDGKRHEELRQVFAEASAGLIFVTAFPTRQVMTKYLAEIAWETEVWVADAPDHLIHFNGDRFLGPHSLS